MPGEDEQAEEDTDAAAELAPFSWGFPGLAMPEPTRLSEADLQRVLDALPAARVGLIPAARAADALPLLGWTAPATCTIRTHCRSRQCSVRGKTGLGLGSFRSGSAKSACWSNGRRETCNQLNASLPSIMPFAMNAAEGG